MKSIIQAKRKIVKPGAANIAGGIVFLKRDGVIERLGESRIYGNVYEAAADKIPENLS